MSDAPVPIKHEDIELWTFIFNDGSTAAYPLRTERNEKAEMVTNSIDQSLLEIRLRFRSDEDTNESIGLISFVVANLRAWSLDKVKRPVYAKGESPVEMELKRVSEIRAQRASAWEKQAQLREEEFVKELKSIEQL